MGVSLLAVVLSGCTRAPAPEPPVAYFQGASKKAPQYFSPDKPTFLQAKPAEIPLDKPNEALGTIPLVPESVGEAPGAVPAVPESVGEAPGEAPLVPESVGEAGGTAGAVPESVDGAVPASMDEPGPEALAGAPLPAAAVAPVPTYQVIAERFNDRPDDMSHFYVVIDRVDPNVDAFKHVAKQVLLALAAVNGGPVFSASIWDHLSAAQTEVSYRSNPDQFSDELIGAKEAFNDQHLVANYVGGLSSVDEPPSFLLFWYPRAGATSPNVGQWVSAEVWKP